MKLTLSGYYQNTALILRDILETVFLIDLFTFDASAIARWRTLQGAAHWNEFKPAKVRDALDKRDKLSNRKRAKLYGLLSELAGHASLKGVAMLRPLGMDAQIGPFFDPTALQATLDEMGQLAVQAGELASAFVPDSWDVGRPPRWAFREANLRWLQEFYPAIAAKYQPTSVPTL